MSDEILQIKMDRLGGQLTLPTSLGRTLCFNTEWQPMRYAQFELAYVQL